MTTNSSPIAPQVPGGSPLRFATLCVFIAAAAIVPFLPAINAGLSNFDDVGVLKEANGYQGLGFENLRWMFSTTHMGHYQPLTWLSYALEFSIWGLEPRAFHTTNIVLHAFNAVLVFQVARRLITAALARPLPKSGGAFAIDLGAAIAALLFAVHPLRVESVAWITERRDVLSSFFLLAALLAYLNAFPMKSTRPASLGWFVASVALLTLSLLSKAWGMTFFVVLVILDWYPLRRLAWPPLSPANRTVLLQKLPFAALGIAFAIQAGRAQSSMPFVVRTLDQWGISARICQAAYGLCFYVEKLVAPFKLAALYELPARFNPAEPRWAVSLVLVGTAAAGVFLLRRRWPALVAGAMIYVILLSPVLGVFQSGIQLVADRYSYVANIAWAMLIGGAATALALAGKAGAVPALVPRVLTAAAAAGLVGLGALSWQQTRLWGDTERLFAHALAVGQDGPILRSNYGVQLDQNGRRDEALAQYDLSLKQDPAYGQAWFNRANLLKEMGRFPEAEQSYAKAIQFMPDSWRADLMLGILYITSLERPADAARHFRAAVDKVEAPGARSFSSRPYLMLAGALYELGDERGCREMLERAARFPETRAEALSHLRDLNTDR